MSAEKDEGGFDPRKVKKEQADSFEAEARGMQRVAATPAGQESLRVANGYHSGDVLQDILATIKMAGITHHPPAEKNDKIRSMIEDSISEESRSRVQDIYSQVDQMRIEEKLLLLLKLPTSLANPGSTVDPLRQPLNPLGNRYEIHQTIMWIKTHLEEDPEVSLPKQEVYDEYNMFCTKNSMKPLSTADFGKVMKQVYPRVRPRRLGTRGNSRYCYAGMRKRLKLDAPTLPTLTTSEEGEDSEDHTKEDMLGAASTLIREWAESLLDVKFPTLCALGKYLVNNLCVDTRSLAAVCILCTSGESTPLPDKGTSPVLPGTPVLGKPAKLREAQLQLQRKLQQREQIRDQKHRHQDTVSQNQNKDKTVDHNNDGCGASHKKSKKGKANQTVQGTNTPCKGVAPNASPAGRQKKVLKTDNQSCSVSLQTNCDNVEVQSIQVVQTGGAPRVVANDIATLPRESKSRNSRKRATASAILQPSETSPEKQAKLAELRIAERSSVPLCKLSSSSSSNVSVSTSTVNTTCTPTPNPVPVPATPSTLTTTATSSSSAISHPGKISVILASNIRNVKCNKTTSDSVVAAVINQTLKSCDIESSASTRDYSKANGRLSAPEDKHLLTRDQIHLLQGNSGLVDRKLGAIDTGTLIDYLNGGNNSQEQEEELLQYFQQSNSSSSDMELGGIVTEVDTRHEKASQLRFNLQEKLNVEPVLTVKEVIPIEKREPEKHSLILPTLLNHTSHANSRRRVSFETNVVEHVQDPVNHHGSNTVPQSPNTRRRIFNFTPISPGPHSPINGRASKPNSESASPFVSPRNTPVPRSRSNLQANGPRSRGGAVHKTLSRSISCNVPCRNDTFVVPTSGPDLVRQTSLRSPLVAATTKVHVPPVQEVEKSIPCSPFLSDLATSEPLLINYPSQENLQEIKNVHRKRQPTDQEISDLLHGEKMFIKEQFYRSQSVPLHRMVNPALLSPISTLTPSFHSHSFNASSSSSVAPTPVPSEFTDFGPISGCDGTYMLDVDPSLVTSDQSFLIEDKEMIPDNFTNILDMLNDGDGEILASDEGLEKGETTQNSIILDGLPSGNLNLPDDSILDSAVILDGWSNGTVDGTKMIHSRSYPNTPAPNTSTTTYAVQYAEDSNGSRSYPSTPLHGAPTARNCYRGSNEPMLSSPTLNALNLRSQVTNARNSCSASVVECNVADLLDSGLLDDDGDADDLHDPLGNFEGLQDVDSLAPLFNEVVEPNH